MGDLDDVYTLKVEVADKPEEICVDGCVYTRSNASNAGEEYCFKNENTNGTLECQVSIYINVTATVLLRVLTPRQSHPMSLRTRLRRRSPT